MRKEISRVLSMSVAISVCLLLGASFVRAQNCGLPGLLPCPSKTTPKKTTPKKPTPKPIVSKPTNSTKKPQTKFVPRAPKIEMVKILAGSFMMGSDDGATSENPVHKVIISRDFWMGKYEVTQAQWRAVMGNNPSEFSNCGGNCPVEYVSWNDVQEFIKKLNSLQNSYEYRLPSEAEWEYACRAGTTGDNYGNLDSIAWYEDNSDNKTHPVGEKQPNAFGLYDMIGNVMEWCQDWLKGYPSGTLTDPTGAKSGSNRVARGGSWVKQVGKSTRSASRSGGSPSDRYSGGSLGFRLIRY